MPPCDLYVSSCPLCSLSFPCSSCSYSWCREARTIPQAPFLQLGPSQVCPEALLLSRPSPFCNEAVPTLFAFVYLRHSWIGQHLGWGREACPFTLSASDPRTIRPFSRFAPPSPLTVLQVTSSMHEPKIQACFVTANQKDKSENRLVCFAGCLKAILFLWKSAFSKILKRTERECCIAFPLTG